MGDLYKLWQQENPASYHAGLEMPNKEIVVAEYRGHIIGFGLFAVIQIGKDFFTQGHYVYVIPMFRNLCIGNKLYRWMRQRAKELGYPILMTATEADKGKWAKRGFRPALHIMIRQP